MKKKQIALAAALGCTLLLAGHALAAGAGSEPAELDADTVEYDMTTGVIQATDNVLMKQGDTHIAGQRAVYNTKTQQGTVTGGVIAVRGAMRMTCQEVIADGREHIRANGDVHGTENVMQLALNAAVDRVVYVSSVHAIPEKPLGQIISEVSSFSPELVHGQYAKSKAAAAQVALDYAKKGLNLSIVHPSGIIGPGDTNIRNHMIRTIHAMAEGRIPIGLKGGYDFVDSRDVVSGILSCEEKGRCGECYILTGHYITVLQLLNVVRKIHGKKERKIEIPYGLVKAIAPISEGAARLIGRKAPLFTPYSVYTLHTNGDFSHEKATRELDYQPRDIVDSIRDSL